MLLRLPQPLRDALTRVHQTRITPRLLLRLIAGLVLAAAVVGFVWVLWTESVYRR
jgi:hypothetical protein